MNDEFDESIACVVLRVDPFAGGAADDREKLGFPQSDPLANAPDNLFRKRNHGNNYTPTP